MICDDGQAIELPVLEFLNLVLFDAEDHYILRDMNTGTGTRIEKKDLPEEKIQELIDEEGWERVNIWENQEKS